MGASQVLLFLASIAWSRISVTAGDPSCVSEQRFTEQEFLRGTSGPFQLYCPADPNLLTSPKPEVTWLKDCGPLPGGSPSSPARVVSTNTGKAYLQFSSLGPENQGNYTCSVRSAKQLNASYTVRLTISEPVCTSAPKFKPSGTPSEVWGTLGSTMVINCTAVLAWDPSNPGCESSLRWSKDGQPLSNHSLFPQNQSLWFPGDGQAVVSSILEVGVREQSQFGLYSCEVRNVSATFSLRETSRPTHTAAVIAAVVLLLALGLAALVFSKCHLNFKLWYKNAYGDYEINDGKMYDAYISYVNNDNDRKFVNFILKPHLENKYGHKLLLNDSDILPGTEPSAELLMNVSRCRRLVVVLTQAYLEQDWCTSNFRQGLWHLLDVSQKPIFITFQSQQKYLSLDVSQQLREHQPRITTLIWGAHSMTPSSAFWKELALAMPRKVVFRSDAAGDPQTLLQEDKDPMLILHPDYLDCRPDPDAAGDLGLRLPIYKALSSKAPVLPAAPAPVTEPQAPEIDLSDLGTRSYAARTDFYCLVTEDDI